MTRVSVCAVATLILLGAGSARADDKATDEEKVIARIEKLRGAVKRDDKLPGKPVVEVDLRGSPVGDGDLKQLAVFKSLSVLRVSGAMNISDQGLKEIAALANLQTLW